MTFTLDENEAMFIMQVLGELPSRTGAFVVLQNIDKQYKAQRPQEEAPQAE